MSLEYYNQIITTNSPEFNIITTKHTVLLLNIFDKYFMPKL
jgi:hypothetical protein